MSVSKSIECNSGEAVLAVPKAKSKVFGRHFALNLNTSVGSSNRLAERDIQQWTGVDGSVELGRGIVEIILVESDDLADVFLGRELL